MNEVVFALVACFVNPPAAAENGIEPRGCMELAVYDSRTECGIVIPGLKIHAKGARLSCQPRAPLADERAHQVVRK